jgi:hypothetical protein
VNYGKTLAASAAPLAADSTSTPSSSAAKTGSLFSNTPVSSNPDDDKKGLMEELSLI